MKISPGGRDRFVCLNLSELKNVTSVQIEIDEDLGINELPIKWFGDYGDEAFVFLSAPFFGSWFLPRPLLDLWFSELCNRARVVPFDDTKKNELLKEITRVDRKDFHNCFEEASRVHQELKEEWGSLSPLVMPPDVRDCSLWRKKQTEFVFQDPPKRRSRRKKAPKKAAKKPAPKTTRGRKRRRAVEVDVDEEELDASDLRDMAFEAVMNSHAAEDLTSFVALLYHHLQGSPQFTKAKATKLVGDVYDLSKDEVEEVVAAFEKRLCCVTQTSCDFQNVV